MKKISVKSYAVMKLCETLRGKHAFVTKGARAGQDGTLVSFAAYESFSQGEPYVKIDFRDAKNIAIDWDSVEIMDS